MNATRTAAPLRAFGKPVLAGVLVLLLFMSALASASPALHHWLHSDHQAPSHYCLVTVLEHGQTDVASVGFDFPPFSIGVPFPALQINSFFISHNTKLYRERAPP